MKANLSPLKLTSFALLRASYEYIVPEKVKKGATPSNFFDSYNIEIDFSHKEEDCGIAVIVKVEVNNTDKPKPGYKLFYEAGGTFSLPPKENLKEEVYNNLYFYSTISIIIGNIRNIIAATTANGPFGTYLLPPIDINSLFKAKKEELKK